MRKRIITLIVGVLFVLSLIYFILFLNLPERNPSSDGKEKVLLDKILTEINSNTFAIEKCDELLMSSSKQICYKAFIVRKITKNELFDKNVCYKLIESSDKQVCLSWTEGK